MKLVETLADMREVRSTLVEPVGVVPTMGALHDGHLALVRRACAENNTVIVTIFVNPTQFNNAGDLAKYPRNLEQDMAQLGSLGVEVVFAPTAEVMYPPGHQTTVEVGEIATGLEGAHRPGHFRGVTTVVAKLFNITQPARAYFGQKDAQQVAVIRQMVADLNFPLEVVVCPTVREPDGLAMSSRNQHLTFDERQAGPVLYRALSAAREAFDRGTRDAETLRQIMQQMLAGEPLAQVEYVSVADANTLRELYAPVEAPALLSLAVNIGQTRMIDNLLLSDADV